MTSPDPYLVGADYGGGLFGRSEELIEPSRPGASADDLLEGLTEPQQRAVLQRGGPLLIVAGAGSGKTRVLTRRIAHLLATGDARPFEILAITFTNKAAGEMRERVAELVGPTAKRMWVATFHSACLRLLRASAPRLGFDPNFTVYDATDSRRLVELVMADLNIDTKKLPARSVASVISQAKAELLTPDAYANDVLGSMDPYRRKVAEVYASYQRRLKDANAMDFDDLLMKTVELLRDCPDVLAGYQERFRHLLVDEFQDTNPAQNEIVKMLGAGHRNVCAVGDSDQSIYRFRAADIRNILDFEQTFPDATTILLEQNFRSTQNILDAANAVIAHNTGRPKKRLFTTDGEGPKIIRYRAEDEYDEASWLASEIHRLKAAEGITFGDVAVFYRTNGQSKAIEEALVRASINYKVIGGTRFYDHREIRDALAFVRFAANPTDEVSARRIINVPTRGIGATSVAKIGVYAAATQAAHLDAAIEVAQTGGLGGDKLRDALAQDVGRSLAFGQVLNRAEAIGLKGKALKGALALDEVMTQLRAAATTLGPSQFVESVLEVTGYRELLVEEARAARAVSSREGDKADERVENLDTLANGAGEYETLEEFLSSVALVADSDQLSLGQPYVSLMTLHIAKGLEFPVAFLVGMEEGIFPHNRALSEPEELEEERRLAYVGITRARKHLALTHAWVRSQWGQTKENIPSRFLSEIPAELVEDVGQSARPRRREQAAWSGSSSSEPWELPRRRVDDDPDGGRVFGGGSAPREAPTSTGGHLLGLVAGDDVIHDRWGAGHVLSVAGDGDRMTAVVRFPGTGNKTLMLSMAPLRRP
jgi:DNA helicase-2/ATP-dependent DNA helicase PcrA